MPATILRRRVLTALVAITVVLGLAVSRLPDPAGDIGGTVLYAVLVYLLVRAASPTSRPARIAIVALTICWAVELLQLTPLPGALVEQVPVAAYVFGTTFNPVDLLGYAAGVAPAGGFEVLVARRRRADPPH